MVMEFFGYLICNTFFAMLSAVIIYYFLKINFKLENRKNSLLFLVLSFGLVNGIVASLWTNLFEISKDLEPFKQISLLVISMVIIKFLLRVNWLKAVLGFAVIMLGTGVGNLIVFATMDITIEDALSSLSTYLVANIVVHVTAIIVIVIFVILIKLTIRVIGKNNGKQVPER
jgi:two-component system sensor histidine kinase AgrC